MKTKQSTHKSAIRIASTVMATTGLIAGGAHAKTDANPFDYQELPSSFQIAGSHEGQCGEGQCGGGSKKAHEEGKCGEGQCGGAARKGKKAKMHMRMRMMEQKIDKMMMMMENMEKKMK